MPGIYASQLLCVFLLIVLVVMVSFYSNFKFKDTYLDTHDIKVLQQPRDPNLQWESIQKARRQRVEDACLQFPLEETKKRKCDYFYLLSDDHNRAIFCFVPKVACTAWRNTMVALRYHKPNVTLLQGIHNPKYIEKLGLTVLSSLNKSEADFRLQTYKRFLFVRNPFERLVSAYRDKFENGSNAFFNKRHGKQIIKLYRKNATKSELESEKAVTFSEFVQYVIGEHNDPHWAPYQDHCCLCRVNYQYYGKFESFQEDTSNILHRVYGMDTDKKKSYFPMTNRNVKGKTNVNQIRHYLKQLTPDTLADLNRFYQKDIYMFGYDLVYNVIADVLH